MRGVLYNLLPSWGVAQIYDNNNMGHSKLMHGVQYNFITLLECGTRLMILMSDLMMC